MSRSARRSRWVSVFVVLVFALKALIPPGYMLAPVDGHARLVMCPAGIHYPAGMHSMAGMVHVNEVGHAEHASLAVTQCPFALAGGVALLAAAGAVAEPHYVTLQPARPCATASVPTTPPARYHAPRGPPSLA